MRDLKNSFYKTLNLDQEEKAILKWFRKVSKELKNESEYQVKKVEKNEKN
jgi:hypothetical protein